MLITSYKKEKEKGNAAAGICWEGHNEIWTSSTRKKQKTKTCQCNVFTYMYLNYKQIHEFIDILKLIFHL